MDENSYKLKKILSIDERTLKTSYPSTQINSIQQFCFVFAFIQKPYTFYRPEFRIRRLIQKSFMSL